MNLKEVKMESTSNVTYFKIKSKILSVFNVFFFLLHKVTAPIFLMLPPNITVTCSTTTKISKKTPHFDEKVNFIRISRKTERKFW